MKGYECLRALRSKSGLFEGGRRPLFVKGYGCLSALRSKSGLFEADCKIFRGSLGFIFERNFLLGAQRASSFVMEFGY